MNAQVNLVLPSSFWVLTVGGPAVDDRNNNAAGNGGSNNAKAMAPPTGSIKVQQQGHGSGTTRSRPTVKAAAATISTNASASKQQQQRNPRDRNGREQVRAQKITQLINELRANMQRGGWKEEMKSKYQTLNQ